MTATMDDPTRAFLNPHLAPTRPDWIPPDSWGRMPWNAKRKAHRRNMAIMERIRQESAERERQEDTALVMRDKRIEAFREVLIALREEHPDWSAEDMASEVDCSARTVTRHIRILRSQGRWS